MVISRAYKIVITTLLLQFAFISVNAQYASEDELKKAADKYFVEQDYIKALPLFSQLLSLYPKDANYNYKYGASFFYAKREKDDALKYLKFAASKPNVDPIAYYFLAVVFHHNYQFSAAEVNYNKFKQKGNSKDVTDLEIDRKIQMCKNGLRLLKSMTDIGVLYKKEIKATDFFRSYDLKGIGGKVVVKPDEFKTKLDLKKNETSLIHLGDNPKMVIFSSYGNDGKTGKDIYRVVKLPNGEWSKPAPIGEGINSEFDEDYPFLHPDGRTLYFSSKGYNSMGGYDIFKSELNPETGKWSYPENLDFPINTPDDDILFISDIDNELAFFASSRASKQGELTVYKVQVETQPAENSVIKGIFIAESNPNMKNAKISVVDAEKDRTYGTYETDAENGNYLLVFPSNGGKYKILVETTDNAPIHSAVIELPVLSGFRALKQELRLVGEGDAEKLVVKNLFDETDEFDITDPLVVENLLKVKAKLDVNLTEEELQAKLNDAKNADASDYADLSNEELLETSSKQADNILNKAKTSRKQADYSYELANQKSLEAKKLFAESVALEKEAENETNTELKQKKLNEANKVKMQAAKLVNETIAALNLAKAIESEANEIETDIDDVANLKEGIANNINSNNRKEAENKYAELEKIADAAYMKQSSLTNESKLAEDKLTEKEIAYNKARNEVIELTNKQIELNNTIDNTEKQLTEASKKNDKENLESQLNVLKIDLEDIKYDLGVAETEEKKLKEEYNSLKNATNTFTTIADNVAKNAGNAGDAKVDKLALDNDVVYFENQGLVGLYAETDETLAQNNLQENNTTNDNTVNLTNRSDEFEIVNEQGEIVDYNTDYSSKLVDADNNNNPYQKNLELAKVNQEWANAIDEEITIREEQLASTNDLNEKIQLESKIEQLKTLKESKEKEANKQLAIAEVLAGGNEENETEVVESVSITNESGDIVDYDTQFKEELASIEANNGNNDKKLNVYKSWNNAIEQEVLLKKVELDNASNEEKNNIESRISELETKKQENDEWIAIYESNDSNEENITDNSIAENNETKNEVVNDVEAIDKEEGSVVNTSSIDYASYKNVVSEDGKTINYSEKYETELSDADNIVDEVEAASKKEQIITSWINNIDEEIALREEELSLASNEEDKEELKNKINDLNALKNEKQEVLVDYQLIAANNSDNENTVANVTSPNTENKNTLNASNTNLTSYEASGLDEELNLKYNNEVDYKGTQSKKELANVNQLKQQALAYYQEAEEKNNSLGAIEDIEERESVLGEINALNDKAERKEVEVAKTYERTNTSEFYNNQEVLSKVKSNASNNENSTIAEMLEDESYTYFNQAKEEREKADNASTFTSKQNAHQKAYNLELQALEKQSKAIELYSNNENIDDVYASVENTSTNNTSNSNVNRTTAPTNSNTENSNNQNESSNNNITEETNNTPIYQPMAISLPSDKERNEAKRLEKEAEVLEAKAKTLTDSAEVVGNKKEKEALIAEATELKNQAQQKRKEAEVYYAKADEMTANEAELVDELNENRTKLSNEKITTQDEAVIASITPEELTEIKNSEEYKNYAEAKKETRRLIKEAEVDYIQADKHQQEAEDEKQLGVSMNALAAGAEGERKEKLLGQIEKLKGMIAENEAKATESRERATEKEKTALEKSKQADGILVTNSELASKIEAVEKVETYNSSKLEELIGQENELADNSSAKLSDNTTSTNAEDNVNDNNTASDNEEILENNTTNDVENELVETDNNSIENEIANNTTENESDNNESVINENTNTSDNNFTTNDNVENESVEDSNELVENENISVDVVENNTSSDNTASNFSNNSSTEEKVTLDEVIANTSGSNVDEIPEVLTSPIFVLTANKSNYSNNKPIPTAEKLPEGLVFKVQIGAFRNPIPQDHFKGFAPIMAENAGNGITRYTAGFFKTINMANEAKNSIRSIGYNDAFVVAFFNGKRISINEARAMLGEELATTNTSNSSTNSNANNASNNTGATTNNNTLPEVETNYEEVNDGVSTDVHKIEGVFFTIQVGVYSKPVTADQLSKVTPLNSEKTKNGLIRYTSGVYKTLEEANIAKDRVRGLGITDAFVIAYANGNRVTVSEAVGYLNNGASNTGASGSTNNSIGNTSSNLPTNNSSSNNTATSNNNTTTNEDLGESNEVGNNANENVSVENNSNTNTSSNTPNTSTNTQPKEPIDQVKIGEELNLDFRVLLGEYEDEVPVEEAAVYLKLSSQGMKVYEKNGKTIYEIGSYPDYPSALDLQLKMKEEGVKKPKVVAFKDGTQIEVNEALELVKNNNK